MNSKATETDRIEQFKADLASGRRKTSGNAAAEKAAAALGVFLMIVGVVLSFGMYIQATNEDIGDGTTNEILIAQMAQNEEQILAIAGVGLVFLGAALFLRAALLRFWRFWMLRSLYESREHTDEVVAAIKER
jgi:hypothetical protein